MRSLISHLRHPVRLLLKSPGFTITAVLILGFGIGLNTAVFSLINAVLLKPLPFPDPDRLVLLFMPIKNDDHNLLDYPDYEDIRAAQHSFQELAVFSSAEMILTGRGAAERISGCFVSPEMFAISGHQFLLGRPFTNAEDKVGGPNIVVLGEKFWRDHFNADPRVIGTTLMISGRALQVIGVAPAQAIEWGAHAAYLPIHLMRGADFSARDRHLFGCSGRLKPGVSLSQAQAELETIHQGLITRYPTTDKGYGIRIARVLDIEVGDYSATLWLVAAAVACLFLIAAANIVNLVLARTLDRRKEAAIRSALGAARFHLVRQSLLESTCLSLFGAAVGLIFWFFAIQIIRVLNPRPDFFRFQEVGFNGETLCFFVGVTVLSSLVLGVFPAWTLIRTNPGSHLKDESNAVTTGPRTQRSQTGLVTVQVAFACVLMIFAGLLSRSLLIVQALPLGFNPDHILTAQIYLFGSKYDLNPRMEPAVYAAHTANRVAFFDTLLKEARSLPGVTSAGLNVVRPFSGFFFSDPFYVGGETDSEPVPVCGTQTISADYFRTLQIPLLAGRDFNSGDQLDSQHVVIIDEAIARRYFPNESAIGEHITFDGVISGHKKLDYTIVGVAHSVRVGNGDEPQPAYQAYFPNTQGPWYSENLSLRSAVDPHDLIPLIRKLVASIDSEVLVSDTVTFDDLLAKHSATRRLGVFLVTLFSGSALFLSAIGLYAVLAYAVTQRKREIGVRIALGAQGFNILRLVLRHGLKIVATGLLIGIGSAVLLTRFIEKVLYGVSNYDPMTLMMAGLVLTLAGLLACLLPAFRATRVKPIEVLRE
jgi:putative ABC transport system permease protein